MDLFTEPDREISIEGTVRSKRIITVEFTHLYVFPNPSQMTFLKPSILATFQF